MNSQATWRSVLRAAGQQYRNQSGMGFLYGLVGVLAVGLLALAAWSPVPGSGLVVALLAIGVLGMIMVGAWFALVANLLLQNHPHVARLVPGHVATLRRAFAVAWLLLTGVAVAGIWMLLATVGAKLGWSVGAGILAADGAGLVLLIVAWATRGTLIGMLVAIAFAASTYWMDTAVASIARASMCAVVQASPAAAVSGAVIALLAAAALTTRMLFQTGGNRHEANYRLRLWFRAAQSGGGLTQEQWRAVSGVGAALVYLPGRLYRRSLQQGREQREGSVLARATLGLGPALHWTGLLGDLMLAGVLWVPLTLWSIYGSTQSKGVFAIDYGVAVGAAFFALGVVTRARAALYATRREQALLMLLPGMPRGGLLNRQLALRLLAAFAGSWIAGIVVVLAVVPRLAETASWPVVIAFAALPTCVLLWQDWSRARPPTAGSAVLPILVAALPAGCVIALQVWLGIGIWPFALCFAVAMLVLLASRWRVLSDAPSAFPLGRLHHVALPSAKPK